MLIAIVSFSIVLLARRLLGFILSPCMTEDRVSVNTIFATHHWYDYIYEGSTLRATGTLQGS